MKRIGKWCIRLLSTALILALVIAALPYASRMLGLLFPQADPVYTTTLLKREMAKVGKLSCLEYQDTGVAAASTSALFLGEVQKISVPYTYQIALGVDLNQVSFSPQADRIVLRLPTVEMLYDSFTVSGEAEIHDFWLPISQAGYQAFLDDQAAACRQAILSDSQLMAQARDAAVEKLAALYAQWLQDEHLEGLPIVVA